MRVDGDDALPVRTLAQTRLIAGALAAGVLIPLAAVGLLDLRPPLPRLGFPVGLLGVVSPVIAYRLFLWLQQRVPPQATPSERCAAFARATLVALALTEGVAFLGIVGYALSGQPAALIGAVTHVLITGALWPTPERMDPFLSPEDGRTPAP